MVRDGGHAPNVVPDHGSMEVYIRAAKLDYLEEVLLEEVLLDEPELFLEDELLLGALSS